MNKSSSLEAATKRPRIWSIRVTNRELATLIVTAMNYVAMRNFNLDLVKEDMGEEEATAMLDSSVNLLGEIGEDAFEVDKVEALLNNL